MPPANLGRCLGALTRDQALMLLNDHVDEDVAAWIETSHGEPALMGTAGCLEHSRPVGSGGSGAASMQVEPGCYRIGEVNLEVPAFPSATRYVYGLRLYYRPSGMTLVMRWINSGYPYRLGGTNRPVPGLD